MTVTTRYFLSLGNVASSLVLGCLAMGAIWYYAPDWFVSLQRGSGSVKEWISSWPFWSTRAESFLRLLLHESSILLVGFTLVTRIVVGAFITLFYKLRYGIEDIHH